MNKSRKSEVTHARFEPRISISNRLSKLSLSKRSYTNMQPNTESGSCTLDPPKQVAQVEVRTSTIWVEFADAGGLAP